MTCKEIQIQIPDFIGKNLNEKEFNVVEKHIKTCTTCKNEVLEFQKLFTKIEDEKYFIPQENYFTNLLPKINNKIELKNRKTKKLLIQFAFSSSTFAAVLLIFLFLLPTKTSESDFATELNKINDEELLSYTETNSTDDEAIVEIKKDIFTKEDASVLQHIVSQNTNIKTIEHIEIFGVAELDSEEILLADLTDEEIQKILNKLK